MMPLTENDFPETETIASAIRFVNSTASHIFLTGKAGTGKTTFLKTLAKRTHKQFVVVAPTGIAAGGVLRAASAASPAVYGISVGVDF